MDAGPRLGGGPPLPFFSGPTHRMSLQAEPSTRPASDPTAPVVTTGGPRHAHLEGFDLHANVAVRAGDRTRLEHLCRYVLRPPVAQGALELTADGTVLHRLRRPWRDGTRAIRFAPTELLEKLRIARTSWSC